eukprot:s1401_g15.t1
MDVEDEVTDADLGTELARILGSSVPSVVNGALAVTPRRSTGGGPMTPVAGAPASARKEQGPTPEQFFVSHDPYHASPGLAHFGIQSLPVPPSGLPPPPGLASPALEKSVPAERADTTTENGIVTLPERLSEKRRAARQALAPFGIPRTTATPAEATTDAVAAASDSAPGFRNVNFVDDDTQEELREASPGFGTLE